MKCLKYLALTMALAFSIQAVTAQGFPSPAEGNAAVYFVRVTSWGGAVSFEFFHNEEFIGVFKGKNYIRYECPAGENLLWASTENKQFLTCDLMAGETYLVLVNVKMGGWKARLDLEPITTDNEDFDRVVELVRNEPPVVTPQEKLDKTTAKLRKKNFIPEMMRRYESEWKDSENNRYVTPDMFIPIDLLQ